MASMYHFSSTSALGDDEFEDQQSLSPDIEDPSSSSESPNNSRYVSAISEPETLFSTTLPAEVEVEERYRRLSASVPGTSMMTKPTPSMTRIVNSAQDDDDIVERRPAELARRRRPHKSARPNARDSDGYVPDDYGSVSSGSASDVDLAAADLTNTEQEGGGVPGRGQALLAKRLGFTWPLLPNSPGDSTRSVCGGSPSPSSIYSDDGDVGEAVPEQPEPPASVASRSSVARDRHFEIHPTPPPAPLRPHIMPGTKGGSEMFFPSPFFHDDTASEGLEYQERADRNVKKYRQDYEDARDSERDDDAMAPEAAADAVDAGRIASRPGHRWKDASSAAAQAAETSTAPTTEATSSRSTQLDDLSDESDTSEYSHSSRSSSLKIQSAAETESEIEYRHGHALQRMPGKVKGFNDTNYYHHKTLPPFRIRLSPANPHQYLHHHYLDPWQQLHLFGEAEADEAYDEDDATSFTTETSISFGPSDDEFEYGYEAEEATGGMWDSDDQAAAGRPSHKRVKVPRKAFHLPTACLWSETGHDVRVLLRGLQTQIKARTRLEGGHRVLVDSSTQKMLDQHEYHVDARHMVRFHSNDDPATRHDLAIKQLPLYSTELNLILELNQAEVRNDPWNHVPPILEIQESEPEVPDIPLDELDNVSNLSELFTGDMEVRLFFGRLEHLTTWEMDSVAEHINMFRQLLEGLTFLSSQRIAGLNCSDRDSFGVSHGDLVQTRILPAEGSDSEVADQVFVYLSRGALPSASPLESNTSRSAPSTSELKNTKWQESTSKPKYYFIDFSHAQRLSPLTTHPNVSQSSFESQQSTLSEEDADPASEPFTREAQQDVCTLGTLFADFIASAPLPIKATLETHFTLLIQAMMHGGFTADESRRLCDMISSKWEQGSKFTFDAVHDQPPATAPTTEEDGVAGTHVSSRPMDHAPPDAGKGVRQSPDTIVRSGWKESGGKRRLSILERDYGRPTGAPPFMTPVHSHVPPTSTAASATPSQHQHLGALDVHHASGRGSDHPHSRGQPVHAFLVPGKDDADDGSAANDSEFDIEEEDRSHPNYYYDGSIDSDHGPRSRTTRHIHHHRSHNESVASNAPKKKKLIVESSSGEGSDATTTTTTASTSDSGEFVLKRGRAGTMIAKVAIPVTNPPMYEVNVVPRPRAHD